MTQAMAKATVGARLLITPLSGVSSTSLSVIGNQATRADESEEPGQRRQLPRQVVGDRRQPPRAAAVGEQRSAQAQHEGQEHAEAHRRLGQARALRSPMAGILQPVPGQRERQPGDQDVGQDGQERQQRAPQPPDRNGARRQPGQAAFGQPEADGHDGQHAQGADQKLGRAAPPSAVATPDSNSPARVRKRAWSVFHCALAWSQKAARRGESERLRSCASNTARRCASTSARRCCALTDIRRASRMSASSALRSFSKAARCRVTSGFSVLPTGARCRPQFAQACVEVDQLSGARGHEAFGLRHDVVGEVVDGPDLVLAVGRLGHLLRQRAQALQRDFRRCRLRRGRLRACGGAQYHDDQEGRDATDHRAQQAHDARAPTTGDCVKPGHAASDIGSRIHLAFTFLARSAKCRQCCTSPGVEVTLSTPPMQPWPDASSRTGHCINTGLRCTCMPCTVEGIPPDKFFPSHRA